MSTNVRFPPIADVSAPCDSCSPMSEGQIDQLFWAVAAAVGAFVLVVPKAFICLVGYGGRLKSTPSNLLVTVTRVCAALMLLGAVAELVA